MGKNQTNVGITRSLGKLKVSVKTKLIEQNNPLIQEIMNLTLQKFFVNYLILKPI